MLTYSAAHFTWHGDEKVSVFLQRLGIFPDDVIETEIEFVEGESLRSIRSGFSGGIRIGLFVIDLQAGEGGILKAHVDADDVIHDRVRLVRLQRRGDGQTRRRIAIQNIHLKIERNN